MTGIELLENIKSFNTEFYAELVINETKQQAADILAVQLSSGVDGNEKKLNNYAASTIKFKRKKGKGLGAVTDRRTNYMTGAHYAGLFVQARAGEVLTGSDDPKSKYIQQREGDAIYKMNADSRVCISSLPCFFKRA
jgi:hypothetical protein